MKLLSSLLVLLTVVVVFHKSAATCRFPVKLCKTCITQCPPGEELVKSPCGCCYNQCVPCEDGNTEIEESSTTVTSPSTTCPPCHKVKCHIPICPIGTILALGQGPCGCCPGCVTPRIGDKCYLNLLGFPTCGLFQKCSLGLNICVSILISGKK